MTYEEALTLDLGEMIEVEGGFTGKIVEIKHQLDTPTGERYLRIIIHTTVRNGFVSVHGPFQPHQIGAKNLLQRMAEAANDDQGRD